MRSQRSGCGLLSLAAKLASFVERRRGLAETNKRVNASRLVALTGSERPGNQRPALRVLATMRQALGIAGEAGWLVH